MFLYEDEDFPLSPTLCEEIMQTMHEKYNMTMLE